MSDTVTNNISDEELLDYIQLIRSPNIGPSTFFHLLNAHKTVNNALLYTSHILKQKGKQIYNRNLAEEELSLTRRYGGNIISYNDYYYPNILRQIQTPPPILSFIGDKNSLKLDLIGIVGSRQATINGKVLAKSITINLGERGLSTISGLAIGIDTIVHTTAIKYGYKTVAILGSGINIKYPNGNSALYDKIIDNCGVIITELPYNDPVKKENFPKRNRLISGMSMGVVVVEAAKGSGALITAQFAADQGREVFAVPGSPLDMNSYGTNKLIKDGASLITSADDIIDNIYIRRSINKNDELNDIPNQIDYQSNKFQDKKQRILNEISSSGTKIDEIVKRYKDIESEIHLIITELEIEGCLYRDFFGNIYNTIHTTFDGFL